MSALTDAIEQAGPASVAALIANDPACAGVQSAVDCPEEIAHACNRMGWQTLDEPGCMGARNDRAVGNVNLSDSVPDLAAFEVDT